MKVVPYLETERLLLRGIKEEDTDWIVTWRANRQVYQYFLSPHALTREEHLQWFRSRYLLNDNRFDWLVIEKETNRPIGVFGINKSSKNISEVEINYLLAPEAQGKGYAREGVEVMIEWVKSKLECKSAIAEVHCENIPSITFIEKMEFIKEKQQGNFYQYKRVL